MSHYPWWRGAVIYQIYPRSYLDANGDGVGDLPGIIQRLDHIAALGVDAIWISPFFKSPMADFGYDIADYRDVDPLFGSLDDFDRLLAKAHDLGLKVMIDQVLSHTSIEHAWFRESRQDRSNPKADWYVWADPREDGTPPNNWLSLFGGGAWQWEPRREQYYLHNFLVDQPDLNFHNPDVQQATLDNVRFWLDRGVDGFRLDAINFCFHDAQLRDNPPKPADKRVGRGFSPDNPYAYQYHFYNNTQPENLPFLEQLRALDEYPGAVSLGEISSEDSLATTAEYTQDGRLHMGYSFELLVDDYSAAYIRDTVSRLEAAMTEGWPCWAVSNHDVERAVSRWGGYPADPRLARMLVAMLCCCAARCACTRARSWAWPRPRCRSRRCRTRMASPSGRISRAATVAAPRCRGPTLRWLALPPARPGCRSRPSTGRRRWPCRSATRTRSWRRSAPSWPGGVASRRSCMAASGSSKAPSQCCCSSVCLQMKPSCWPSTCRPKR